MKTNEQRCLSVTADWGQPVPVWLQNQTRTNTTIIAARVVFTLHNVSNEAVCQVQRSGDDNTSCIAVAARHEPCTQGWVRQRSPPGGWVELRVSGEPSPASSDYPNYLGVRGTAALRTAARPRQVHAASVHDAASPNTTGVLWRSGSGGYGLRAVKTQRITTSGFAQLGLRKFGTVSDIHDELAGPAAGRRTAGRSRRARDCTGERWPDPACLPARDRRQVFRLPRILRKLQHDGRRKLGRAPTDRGRQAVGRPAVVAAARQRSAAVVGRPAVHFLAHVYRWFLRGMGNFLPGSRGTTPA